VEPHGLELPHGLVHIHGSWVWIGLGHGRVWRFHDDCMEALIHMFE